MNDLDQQLYNAVENADSSKVRELIKKGADPNMKIQGYESVYILEFASSIAMDVDVVNELITGGADVNVNLGLRMTPLDWASRFGNFELVEKLLEAGALTGSGRSLIPAAERGFFDIVRILIQNKVDINVRNNGGSTPLMMASSSGQLKIVQYLIAAGANINLKNNDGNTAFDLARQKKQTGVVKYFETLFAEDPDAFDPETKITNLMIVSSQGKLGRVQVYLPTIKNINADDKNGNTALIYAVYTRNRVINNNRLKIIKLLIQRGADPTIKNNDGVTSLELGNRSGNTEVINSLQRTVAEKLGRLTIKHKEEIYPYLPGVIKPTDPEMWEQPEIVVPLPPKYTEEYYRKCDETLYPNITRDEIYQLALELGLEDGDIQGLDKRGICKKMAGYLRLIQRQ